MSRLPFELLLALRYLRPRRTFVSIITLISVIGVTVGVWVLIVVLSVMTGFDRELRDKILGFNAHLRVAGLYGKRLDNYNEIIATIRSNSNVKAVAPYVLGQALVETEPEVGESTFFAPYIRGIDPKLEESVSVLPKSVFRGEFNVRGDRIVLGRTIAENYNLHVGDHIAIYAPHDLRKMKETKSKDDQEAVLPTDYEISGIFDVGYYEYNSAFIISSLGNAQELYDLGSGVSGLYVILDDPYKAEAVRRQLGPLLGTDIYISTWLEDNSTFLSALAVEKNVMFVILLLVMIVAAFGITSALITFSVQKTREIGMLKALGATGRQIMWVFLGQSMMVGVIGVFCGFSLGLFSVHFRNAFLLLLRKTTGIEIFPQSIYMFTQLPALIVPRDIGIICAVSLFICLLAGVLPAWNAARLRPVEALRHE